MKKKSSRRKRPLKHFGYTQIYDFLNMQWIPVWTKVLQEEATPESMPSSVSVLGKKYRVKYFRDIYSAPKNTTSLAGVIIFSHQLIVIDPSDTLHGMRATLFHEMCHAYLSEIQAKDNRLQKITPAQIEGFCDLFGEAVIDLTVNNSLPSI